MPIPRQEGFVEWFGIHEHPGDPAADRPPASAPAEPAPAAPALAYGGGHTASLTTDARHRNIQGVVHGSVVMALLDTAMGHALSATLPPDGFCSTTQWSVQFLRASRPGDHLTATGRIVRRGRRIAYLEGVCRNAAGDEIARAQGTWYIGTLAAPGG